MNFSADTGSNYNVTKTSTVWLTWVAEAGGGPSNGINAGADVSQSTGFCNITNVIVGDGDATASGSIRIYNPASTTFVKHFIADFQRMDDNHSAQMWTAGYANTTSAIDAFRFQLDSGTIDTGTFELYGVH